MEIAGYVWDDNSIEGKDQEINGAKDDEEKAIPGVIVTLYKVDPESGEETLAELASGHVRDFKSDKAVFGSKVVSTNPTITDDNGYYSFKGVDASKKYCVKYTYNGVDYEATTKEYKYDGASTPKEVIDQKYNTDEWNRASKGSENTQERNNLNTKFVKKDGDYIAIGSSPKSYETQAIFLTRRDDYLTKENNKYYNKVYIADDLTELKKEIYETAVKRFAITGTVTAIINKNFNSSNNWASAFAGTELYMKDLYGDVAKQHNYDKETMCKLQFIYDSKIDAYAGYTNSSGGSVVIGKNYTKNGKDNMELYPIYDKFKLTKNIDPVLSDIKDITEDNLVQLGDIGRYADNQLSKNKKTNEKGYYYIYVGQLNIGMGLISRQTTTLNLREDLVETVVSINGKDEKYKYGTLADKELGLSMADVYSKTLSSSIVGEYKQKIAKEDYNYSTWATNLVGENGIATYSKDYAPIQIYAKYKITVKNLSSIPTSVNELVTYFNKTYLSYSDIYVTTQGQVLQGISGNKGDKELKNIKTTSHSRYGEKSETLSATGLANYADLYIRLGEKSGNEEESGVMLESNETVTVYVTYRMGEVSTKDVKYSCTSGSAQKILQDTLGKGKEIKIDTYTEVNGFSTYYKFLEVNMQDVIKNEQISESDIAKIKKMMTVFAYKYTYNKNGIGVKYRAAGVMDTYSVPGNLDSTQIGQDTPKEKDWDKAPTLIFGSPIKTRTLSGTVWETKEFAIEYLRNTNKYPILDGSVDQNHKIKDITVELIEIKEDGEQVKQYLRARTTTDDNGNYMFTGYIPGNYVVRFIYGDKALYSKNQSDTMNSKTGMDNYNYPYNGEFYQSAKANPNTNNGVVLGNTRFWYNEGGKRYSDAYDEANIREAVNTKFSNNNLLNPKNGYLYSDAVDTIKNPTEYKMYAYTALMEFYPEKAIYEVEKKQTQIPAYDIANVDFALTPRTKTKLNITKEVSNIRLVLQNGTVKFDATPQTIREQGVPGVVQVNKNQTINISMPNEQLNGATIEITYQITVRNDSEYNSVTYYRNEIGKTIALGLYEESYDKLLVYEKENIITDSKKLRTYNTNLLLTIINTIGTTDSISEGISTVGTTKLEEYKWNNTIVTTTTPTMIADLVANNLNFSHTDATGRVINNGWEIYEGDKENFIQTYYRQKSDQVGKSTENFADFGEINTTEAYNTNTIVVATNENPLIEPLKDGEKSIGYITLSKVISTENGLTQDGLGDTKKYENSIRIVQVNNTVSRIQDMNSTNSTIRLKHSTEPVIITEPTGANKGYMSIAIVLMSTIIIVGGTILIKKFVLK